MSKAWPAPLGPLQEDAIDRLKALDGWLAAQASEEPSENIHDLLTHVVDEISGTCFAVQKAMSGEIPKTAVTATQSQSQ